MKTIKSVKGIFVKVAKVFGWVLASLLFLLITLILLVRLPAIQNKITQKAVSFLESKIGTEVQLEHIFISFPKKIVLKGLYLEDQSKDTLLYAGELSVDTDLWGLLQNQLELNVVELTNCTASIKRSASDSTFNFTYIIEAFEGDQATPDTTATDWEFSIEDVSISNSSFTFQDRLAGNDVTLKIGALELSMEEFDLAQSIYAVESFELMNTQAEIIQSKLTSTNTSDVETSKIPGI
ncbi:MAG TPA: AsmA family protein, partial [Ignavibacteriaceae bacterium]